MASTGLFSVRVPPAFRAERPVINLGDSAIHCLLLASAPMTFYRMTAVGVLGSASAAAFAVACSAGSNGTETQSTETSALSVESAEARPPRGEERVCKEY